MCTVCVCALQIGNQRMATDEYYNLIARLSGTPPPRPVVPVWLAAGWAQAAAALATLTGVPPQVGVQCACLRGEVAVAQVQRRPCPCPSS